MSVAPGTEKEAVEVMRAARDDGVAVRIRGHGTKDGWGRPCEPTELEVTSGGLNRILEYNQGDLTAIIEAGVGLGELQAVLAERGQRLALDPPAGKGGSATVGGVVASADAGPLRHRYGTPRDSVLGVTVVLPGGTVAKSGGKVIKNVAGYDLGKLYSGSFGTLGLILRLALRLRPVSSEAVTVVAASPSVDAVVEGARRMASSPLEPERLDVEWEGESGRLVAELAGSASGARARRAIEILRPCGLDTDIAEDPDGLWERQRSGQRSPNGLVLRISALQVQLGQVIGAARRLGGSLVGRVAHGVSWVAFEPDSAQAHAERIQALRAELALARCVVLDAPEEVRRESDVWSLGSDHLVALMGSVRARIDPDRLCNPGIFGPAV